MVEPQVLRRRAHQTQAGVVLGFNGLAALRNDAGRGTGPGLVAREVVGYTRVACRLLGGGEGGKKERRLAHRGARPTLRWALKGTITYDDRSQLTRQLAKLTSVQHVERSDTGPEIIENLAGRGQLREGRRG